MTLLDQSIHNVKVIEHCGVRLHQSAPKARVGLIAYSHLDLRSALRRRAFSSHGSTPSIGQAKKLLPLKSGRSLKIASNLKGVSLPSRSRPSHSWWWSKPVGQRSVVDSPTGSVVRSKKRADGEDTTSTNEVTLTDAPDHA
eukprot:CAMPEP_0183300328 /NCGR_PEP_ID=MMETSP0160_2-20130417/6794_1 /TAXON_ID=2839 ORGANISM="Odontella Sinensis, Strain Grunow 1884" /NCGR_SAMPLE_ID=MMETSP0160_2 /ASSEMBLY_ACC=CAM_ASM_000250 /LENGTH=140 /DNA_ID=CAMNT_0025462721 /DNA_START=488 /DNA_END=910 /DNA_ORIENTATION=-